MNGSRLALLVLLALAVTGGVLIRAPSAAAHANYSSSVPDADEVVGASPLKVDIFYTQAVQLLVGPAANDLDVRNAAGSVVDNGDVTIDPGNHQHVFVSLMPGLPRDRYTVNWQSLSTDGHLASGTFGFTVGAPDGVGGIASAPPVGASPTASDAAGLRTGALGGIAAAGVAAVVTLGGAGWYVLRRRRLS
jgi:methionine-rich copper-binding protein CopC